MLHWWKNKKKRNAIILNVIETFNSNTACLSAKYYTKYKLLFIVVRFHKNELANVGRRRYKITWCLNIYVPKHDDVGINCNNCCCKVNYVSSKIWALFLLSEQYNNRFKNYYVGTPICMWVWLTHFMSFVIQTFVQKYDVKWFFQSLPIKTKSIWRWQGSIYN